MCACSKRTKAAYPAEHIDAQSIDHPDGCCPHKAQEEHDGVPVELKVHWLRVENGSHEVTFCSVESWSNTHTLHILRMTYPTASALLSLKMAFVFL